MSHVISWKRRTRLLAGGVLSTVLATGGLTSATTAPAAAAPTVTHYTCALPLVGNVDVPVTVDLASLPSTMPAGVPVPAGTVPVTAVLNLPTALLALLGGVTGTAGATSGLSVLVGDLPMPAELTAPAPALPVLGDLALPFSGALGSFTPTLLGELPVTLPTSFDLVGLPLGILGGTGVVPCTLATPGANQVGTVKVVGGQPGAGVKQVSRTRVKVVNRPVHAGQRAKLLVKVKNAFGSPATGGVIAKLRGKKVATGTLKNGKAKLRIKKLAVGAWKVKVTYLGDPATASSKKVVTVRVVR